MLTQDELAKRTRKARRVWDKRASGYDGSMGFAERRLLGRSHRPWVCRRATGLVLEVAVGNGLNLPHYPPEASVVGVDISREMLDAARARADEIGRSVVLAEADAHRLPFGNNTFDAVVCTYSLCNIPDVERALDEMNRVLRPDGRLLLVDHVSSTARPIRWIQRLVELVTVPLEGEHMTRRPFDQVKERFELEERERMHAGVVERLVARKAAPVPEQDARKG